jgi:hypothetical protein
MEARWAWRRERRQIAPFPEAAFFSSILLSSTSSFLLSPSSL